MILAYSLGHRRCLADGSSEPLLQNATAALCNILRTSVASSAAAGTTDSASYSYAACVTHPLCRRSFGLLRDPGVAYPGFQGSALDDVVSDHVMPQWWATEAHRSLQIDVGGLNSSHGRDAALIRLVCSSDVPTLFEDEIDSLRMLAWIVQVTMGLETSLHSVNASLPVCEPRGAGLFMSPTGVGGFQCSCHQRIRGAHFIDNPAETCGERSTDAASSTMIFALVCIIVFQALVLALALVKNV